MAQEQLFDALWLPDMIMKTLRTFEHTKLASLLNVQDRHGQTAQFYLASTNKGDVLRKILDSLDDTNELFNRLRSTTKLRTPLHAACWHGDVTSVKAILDHGDQDMRYSLLKMRTEHGSTPLHCGLCSSRTEIFTYIFKSLAREQWYDLLTLHDNNGCTIVHKLAYTGNDALLDTIKDTATIEQWLKLLCMAPPHQGSRQQEDAYERAKNKISELRTQARIEEAQSCLNKKGMVHDNAM